MRRRTFLTLGSGSIEASKSVAGDVCLYDKKKNILFIISCKDINSTLYPSSDYTPIGVVVVPGIHDIYGTGECAIVSLVNMNCNTPTTGSIETQSITWGKWNLDQSSLKNYNSSCHCGQQTTLTNEVQGTGTRNYLPSDYFNETSLALFTNPYDMDTKYVSNETYYYAPSPYNDDDTRNPAYYQTSSPSSTANCLSDFDGVGNTYKIILVRGTKDYSTWKPGNYRYTDYSAASCCDMYYTDGTNQGDWYLPAMGELGYLAPKLNSIQESLIKLKSVYNDIMCVELHNQEYVPYHSSTEYDKNDNNGLCLYNGLINDIQKDNDGLFMVTTLARAFLRVK